MSPLRVAVVGGGIAGLSATWTLRRQAVASGRPVEVRVFEASDRLGGKVGSERRDGFLLETGPDSFLTRKPQAVELARELGLGHRIIDTHPDRNRVWMVRHGELAEIPPSMGHVLPCRLAPIWGSQLLSWRGKLRLALDLVLPRRRSSGDESLGSFLRRRFGQEMLDRLAGPLLAGIYVADPDSLSLAATFPHFAEIERRHGSVIRGLRAHLKAHSPGKAAHHGREAAHPPAARAHGSAPAPSTRAALAGGIGELTDALIAQLRQPAPHAEVHLNTQAPVDSLERTAPEGRWRLTAGGETREADAVILALPAFAAAGLLAPFLPAAAETLAAIPYVSTATVSLGYREDDLPRPLDGYGFVVPAAEGRRITACTWCSAKFPGRAADGHALLRVFLGGAQGQHHLEADDETLVRHARRDLADLMSLDADPVLTVVHRHPRGTPQYQVGHKDRITALESALPEGLHLAGSAFHGIGLPDCIKSGDQAATAVMLSGEGAEIYAETLHLARSPRNAARLQEAIQELRSADNESPEGPGAG